MLAVWSYLRHIQSRPSISMVLYGEWVRLVHLGNCMLTSNYVAGMVSSNGRGKGSWTPHRQATALSCLLLATLKILTASIKLCWSVVMWSKIRKSASPCTRDSNLAWRVVGSSSWHVTLLSLRNPTVTVQSLWKKVPWWYGAVWVSRNGAYISPGSASRGVVSSEICQILV